jgi:hypothetical protein
MHKFALAIHERAAALKAGGLKSGLIQHGRLPLLRAGHVHFFQFAVDVVLQ